MKLNVKERLILQNLLPTQGDFISLSLREDIVKKTALKQDEIKKIELKSEDGQLSWNNSKDFNVETVLSDTETEFIKKVLKDLDSSKKLTLDSYSIYKKFN